MLRFAGGAVSALLLVLAGFFIWKSNAQREAGPPPAPAVVAEPIEEEGEGEEVAASRPRRPPSADARTKEQRRFDRADKNKNGQIALDELYLPRRRAYARLDRNGDGRLSFEEWAVRTSTKFGEADRNRDGALTREEYATTAPRRRAPSRTKAAACEC